MEKEKHYFNVENNCLYCNEENNTSEHFICCACGIGMCKNCYDLMKEHDEHCFDFHESIEDESLYNHIVKSTGFKYGYMCYECIGRFKKQLDKA